LVVDPGLLDLTGDRPLNRPGLLLHLLGRNHHGLGYLLDLLLMMSLVHVRCAKLHGLLVIADAHFAEHFLGNDHGGCAARCSASAVASVADSRHSAAAGVP